MDYTKYNDYELLDYISENNEDANTIMFKKYEPLIKSTAKKIYKRNKIVGIDMNDLIQEGMLGLSKAIDTFNEQKENTFYTYAKVCIERRMISFLISSNRLKRRYLNEAISIEATDSLVDKKNIEFLFKSETSNPENILLSEEKINTLKNIASTKLTDFEMQVFELKISGFEYKEIATILEKDTKSIDNAIQRIKNKLKKELTVI